MTAVVVDVGKQYGSVTVHGTQSGYWMRCTGTGVLVAVPCQIIGFFVNSTSAGTITLYDSATSATNQVGGAATPAIGMQWFPGIFLNGLYAAVTGTLDATFFYVK